MSENLPEISLNQQLKMPSLYARAHMISYLMVFYAVGEIVKSLGTNQRIENENQWHLHEKVFGSDSPFGVWTVQ